MSPQALCATALATILLAAPAVAQQSDSSIPADGRVFGEVLDEETRSPISGALVLLSDGRTTETDGQGHFFFPHVRPGAHQIAAVTHGCAYVEGGFNVQSGRDSRLQLVISRPAAREKRNDPRGTATRVVTEQQLAEAGSRSALEALDQHVPNVFRADGHRLLMVARGGNTRSVEPVLIVDGVRLQGQAAEALRGLRARDVVRIEVHLGSAAAWEFQPGGAYAAIEVTSRTAPETVGDRRPESCIARSGR